MTQLQITPAQLADPCAGCGAHLHRPSLCCQEFVVQTPLSDRNRDQVDLHVLHWYLVRGHAMGWRVVATFDKKPSKKAECWTIFVRQQCPSLGTRGECTTYESRPVICREYPPFPAVRAGTKIAYSGCERYDPQPAPAHTFTDPNVLAAKLAEWFRYDLGKHRRFEPDFRRVEVVAPPGSTAR